MVHALALDAGTLWRVLVAALVLGAGLPVLFAVGVRAGASGASVGEGRDVPARARPAARVVAVLCFALVLAVVALGITYVVATGSGMTLSFEHVWPTLVPRS